MNTFYILIAFIVVSVVVFAIIYQQLPTHSFIISYDPDRGDLNFSEAVFNSVSTQTLLGHGNLVPRGAWARSMMMIQSSLSLFIILFATKGGWEKIGNTTKSWGE